MKTTFISAILLTASLLASAQAEKFTIKGRIGNLNAPATVYIDYTDNGSGKGGSDSVVLKNGQFSFSGETEGYAYARMALSHDGGGKGKAIYAPNADVIYFYFGAEKIKMNDTDSLIDAKISGSPVYNEYQTYNEAIGGTIMDLTAAANADFAKGSPEQQKDTAFINAVNKRFRSGIAKRASAQIKFAQENPNSFFGLVALSEGTGDKFDPEKIGAIYSSLDEKLQATDMGQELAQRIEAAKMIKIGELAPDFAENSPEGESLDLKSLRGKYVLVEFWASWCGPCRAENPNLREQYAVYKDKGFEIMAISLDNDKEKWEEAIAKDQLPWLHVSDLKGWNSKVGRMYGIRAVPANFLLDPSGKIIALNLRGEELNKKLQEVFPN